MTYFRTTSCKYKTIITAQIWGLTYTQIWSEMQILEAYAEFESFRLHREELWICHRGNLAC